MASPWPKGRPENQAISGAAAQKQPVVRATAVKTKPKVLPVLPESLRSTQLRTPPAARVKANQNRAVLKLTPAHSPTAQQPMRP